VNWRVEQNAYLGNIDSPMFKYFRLSHSPLAYALLFKKSRISVKRAATEIISEAETTY
jgi:hypothetical protein